MTSVQPLEPVAAKSARPDAEDPQKSSIQIVEFVLGNELFAIDLFDVKEVVESTTITPLPGAPAYVRGIIDLRGEITTIIDLRQRLNIAESDGNATDSARIIVLDAIVTKTKSGILVDDVTSVSTIEAVQIDYSSASVSKKHSSIIGIIKRKIKNRDRDKNELIIWIDMKKILSDNPG